ncbi:MAG: DUF4139 domain-containing protein [Myxococcales bacterium]|nr:DUF4139 domain-containing protein [Myxococcales bacterium]
MARASHRVLSIPLALLLCGALADSGEATAPAAPTDAQSTRIDDVLVYSNAARITRRARVRLGRGLTRVRVATLPNLARRATVQVKCNSARVLRVEVIRSRGVLPRQKKARELIKKLRAAAAQRRAVTDESSTIQSELGFLDGLRPSTRRPVAGERRPPAGIYVAAWQRIFGWVETRASALRKRLLVLAEKRHAVDRELYRLHVEGKALDLASSASGAWQVVATMRGGGAHDVTVSYLVAGVRWVPSYDLRYLPSKRAVQADYYAMVRQRSGEDWSGVKLRFSTTLPTRLLAVPELPTWTVGRKRDFFPTPRPRYEPAPGRWRPRRRGYRVPRVLRELRRAMSAAPSGARPRKVAKKLAELERKVEQLKQRVYRGKAGGSYGFAGLGGRADGDSDDAPPAEPKPAVKAPPPARDIARSEDAGGSYHLSKRRYKRRPRRRFDFDGRTISGQIAKPSGSAAAGPTPTSVPWTDVGYVAPTLDPDLPAAAAEGYRFVLWAPGRHDIDSDGKDRRVPLLKKRLAVQLVHRIVPGRSKAAYLQGKLTNTTGRPILRGQANLFTGSMFSGRSFLLTSLPGKSMRLPLGVDDGVKVARHTRQSTVSSGVVFKDDVTRYTVSIEVSNNHGYPINVEVVDQVPVKLGQKVTVRNFASKAQMDQPDKQGRVRWRGRVKKRSVQKIEFSFEIVRPKDWELRQQ